MDQPTQGQPQADVPADDTDDVAAGDSGSDDTAAVPEVKPEGDVAAEPAEEPAETPAVEEPADEEEEESTDAPAAE